MQPQTVTNSNSNDSVTFSMVVLLGALAVDD
jgi:hypothetical protein